MSSGAGIAKGGSGISECSASASRRWPPRPSSQNDRAVRAWSFTPSWLISGWCRSAGYTRRERLPIGATFMRARTFVHLGTAALAAVLATPLAGQSPAAIDPALLSGLTFRAIGPTSVGGRVDDFAVGRAPGRPDAVYVATASGGVFKSANGGVSWTPVFDRVDGMLSIGAIAVARTNPDVVWAGTGEANTRQSSSWGDGVYKSTDAGKTWTNMGLKDTRSINRVLVDPVNPDIVFVAAAGHLWGPNAERGIFKTTDGGKTWKKTLFVDDSTGANDIVMEPGNPRVLYASMYQHERKSWGFNGGGPGSGIYKSTDAGNTWRRLSGGLPKGDMGRIGMDIFKSDR